MMDPLWLMLIGMVVVIGGILVFRLHAFLGRTLLLPTNHLALPAETIAALDKSRWEIELFFTWIRDNLRVKVLYGTSPNAVTQTWIAVKVYLSLAILKNRYRLQPNLSKLLPSFEVKLLEPKLLISAV